MKEWIGDLGCDDVNINGQTIIGIVLRNLANTGWTVQLGEECLEFEGKRVRITLDVVEEQVDAR